MDNLEDLKNMFSEFLTIYKFVNKKTIADMLNAELSTRQKLEIYRLTDGEHSTREISGLLTQKCAYTTIAKFWKQWAQKGIVVATNKAGRVKAAFNLEEYGIYEIKEEE